MLVSHLPLSLCIYFISCVLPVPLISRLLMATEVQAKAAIANISGFLSENERILADIDSLISQLSDVHASISLVRLTHSSLL